jgi:hypothetical protein
MLSMLAPKNSLLPVWSPPCVRVDNPRDRFAGHRFMVDDHRPQPGSFASTIVTPPR